MSGPLVDAALRLEAWQAGVSVPRAGVGRCALQDSTMVISVAGMAGEPQCLWGVLVGPPGGSGQLIVEGDPRRYVDQLRLWQRLGATLGPWLDRVSGATRLPQFVVAHDAAVDLLAASAARFMNHDDAVVARAAGAIRFAADRADRVGQQTLIVATRLAADHFAAPTEDAGAHLPVASGWLEGCSTLTPEVAATQLARWRAKPAGVLADPSVDVRALSKPVELYNRSRDARSGGAKERATSIGGPLKTFLVEQRRQTLVVAGHYRDRFIDASGMAAVAVEFYHDDLKAWEDFVGRRRDGLRLARRDSAGRAVVGLVERTAIAEIWQARLYAEDPLEQLRGIEDGDVLVGRVIDHNATAVLVASTQTRLRLRPGDRLSPAPGTTAEVLDVAGHAGAWTVSINCETHDLAGSWNSERRLCAGPVAGTLGEVRGRVRRAAQRAAQLGWTHDRDAVAPGPQPTVSDGAALLDQVNALRSAP